MVKHAGRIQIRKYIHSIFGSYQEHERERLIALFAEDACNHFDGRAPDETIPERYFDCAWDVFLMREDKSDKPIPAGLGMWLINQADSSCL